MLFPVCWTASPQEAAHSAWFRLQTARVTVPQPRTDMSGGKFDRAELVTISAPDLADPEAVLAKLKSQVARNPWCLSLRDCWICPTLDS